MADMRRAVKKQQGDYTGVGFIFNNDVSGDSRYGTTQLYIPLSYIKKLKDSTLLVSVGIQPGISNIGFRTNKLTFDNQYDGGLLDALGLIRYCTTPPVLTSR